MHRRFGACKRTVVSVKSPSFLKLLKPEKSIKKALIFGSEFADILNLFSESPTSKVVSSSFVLNKQLLMENKYINNST